MRGTVKFFCTKGWGFITDGNGKDWYFHHSNVIMDGYKHLFTDDIVDFEVGIGKNGREQALNVTPILTIKMVEDALKKDNLYLQILQISKDDRCVCLYRVVDSNDILQTDENGMTLVEVAAYAGIDVSEIVCDFMTGKEISDVTNIYIKLPKEKQYEIDDLCKYLWEIEKSKEITICYSDEKAEKVVFEENMPNGISEYKYKILQTVVTKFVTKGGGMVLRIHSANSNDVIMGFSCLNMEIKCLSVNEIKYAMELQPDGSRVIYDDQEYAVADICF